MTFSISYRAPIAGFLAILTTFIVISGVVFMHKEVTSTGEIVTHIHPYNLGEKTKHHHNSDAQIHYLDILYQGTYLYDGLLVFNFTIPFQFVINYSTAYFDTLVKPLIHHNFRRGPPVV